MKGLEKEVEDRLIKEMKSGNKSAEEELYKAWLGFVNSIVVKALNQYNLSYDKKQELASELSQTGWLELFDVINKYDSSRENKFTTYAYTHIKNAIYNRLAEEFKSPGVIEDLSNIVDDEISISKNFYADEKSENLKTKCLKVAIAESFEIPKTANVSKISAERRTLQLVEFLKKATDEEQSLSKEEIRKYLPYFRYVQYGNAYQESENTLTSELEEVLMQLNPDEYTGDNDDEFRIKYSGYEDNRLKKNKENTGIKDKKAKSITDFSYVHLFNNKELDRLISAVCFSDLFSSGEKARLVKKLISTASIYYETPFWRDDNLSVNPKAVYSRLAGRNENDKDTLAENVKLIQDAINNLWQIQFRFNAYNEDGEMVLLNNRIHTLSPYRLVVYQDNFYCIGFWSGENKIRHYRVDLMSDLEVRKNETGMPLSVDINQFIKQPVTSELWDPEKYMSEHLYMAYDKPKKIRIKIKCGDYTFLHDWFGAHYTKEGTRGEYDIVNIVTSPSMIIPWAMQYSEKVEILDEDIRNDIKKRLDTAREKYSEFE